LFELGKAGGGSGGANSIANGPISKAINGVVDNVKERHGVGGNDARAGDAGDSAEASGTPS
jgi:hypothetical protein